MRDIDLNEELATPVIKMIGKIDPNVEVVGGRLNNDFYTFKLQSGNKSGVAKIRCNLLNDLNGGDVHLYAELGQTLRDSINCMK